MQLGVLPRVAFTRYPRTFSLLEEEGWADSDTISGLSMSEDEKKLYVEAALPGVDPKDIAATFDKGVLRISGTKEEEEEEGRKYYRKSSRIFSYRILMPDTADDQIEPEVLNKNGIIKVAFAKKSQSDIRRLKIKSE